MSAKATSDETETGISQTGFAVVQTENGFGDVTNAYALADEGVVGVEVWLPDEDEYVGVETELV